MIEDLGNPKQVREHNRDAKAWERQRIDLFTSIMEQQVGRRWIYEVLESCHVFHTSFSPDTTRMAFAEGERNVGLRFLGLLSSNPRLLQLFSVALKEDQERRDAPRPTDPGPDTTGNGGDSSPNAANDPNAWAG